MTKNCGSRSFTIRTNCLYNVRLGSLTRFMWASIKRYRLKEAHMKRVRDPRRTLYKQFVRIVKDLDPQFFVMENVPSILSFRGGKIRDEIVAAFRAIGYETTPKILNAADYGIPQVRKRAFFIGNRLGLENPFPESTHMDWRTNPQLNWGELPCPYLTM